MVMGFVTGWCQAQLSPFCLPKVGMATSLPVPPWLPALHLGALAASGVIGGCTQRRAVTVGRWPSECGFVHGIKRCPPHPACHQAPAPTESLWRGEPGQWGPVGVFWAGTAGPVGELSGD